MHPGSPLGPFPLGTKLLCAKAAFLNQFKPNKPDCYQDKEIPNIPCCAFSSSSSLLPLLILVSWPATWPTDSSCWSTWKPFYPSSVFSSLSQIPTRLHAGRARDTARGSAAALLPQLHLYSLWNQRLKQGKNCSKSTSHLQQVTGSEEELQWKLQAWRWKSELQF